MATAAGLPVALMPPDSRSPAPTPGSPNAQERRVDKEVEGGKQAPLPPLAPPSHRIAGGGSTTRQRVPRTLWPLCPRPPHQPVVSEDTGQEVVPVECTCRGPSPRQCTPPTITENKLWPMGAAGTLWVSEHISSTTRGAHNPHSAREAVENKPRWLREPCRPQGLRMGPGPCCCHVGITRDCLLITR